MTGLRTEIAKLDTENARLKGYACDCCEYDDGPIFISADDLAKMMDEIEREIS